jgi:hypothetical protein
LILLAERDLDHAIVFFVSCLDLEYLILVLMLETLRYLGQGWLEPYLSLHFIAIRQALHEIMSSVISINTNEIAT